MNQMKWVRGTGGLRISPSLSGIAKKRKEENKQKKYNDNGCYFMDDKYRVYGSGTARVSCVIEDRSASEFQDGDSGSKIHVESAYDVK